MFKLEAAHIIKQQMMMFFFCAWMKDLRPEVEHNATKAFDWSVAKIS